MTSLRTQNALLFVIAACLVLLVVHFYSGHLVAKVYAAQAVSAPAPWPFTAATATATPPPALGKSCVRTGPGTS